MSIGQRITKARKHRKISQARLATLIGVSRGACGQWEREITCPSTAHLASLALFLEVNFEWLATGRGEMEYVGGVNERAPIYNASDNATDSVTNFTLTDGQKKWLEIYNRSSKEQRALLLAYFQTIR